MSGDVAINISVPSDVGEASPTTRSGKGHSDSAARSSRRAFGGRKRRNSSSSSSRGMKTPKLLRLVQQQRGERERNAGDIEAVKANISVEPSVADAGSEKDHVEALEVSVGAPPTEGTPRDERRRKSAGQSAKEMKDLARSVTKVEGRSRKQVEKANLTEEEQRRNKIVHHARPMLLSHGAKKLRKVPNLTSKHIFARKSFAEMGLGPRFVSALMKPKSEGGLGPSAVPTHAQVATFSVVRSGRSAFLKSETGSGKTLAFLLPVLQRLDSLENKVSRADGTYVLVLAPTRELACQISQVATSVCRHACVNIVPGTICGGEKRKAEKARLRKGLNVLVATPGRLLDHLENTRSLRLPGGGLEALVLDEADRLCDMGFEQQILKIVNHLLDMHYGRRRKFKKSTYYGKNGERKPVADGEGPETNGEDSTGEEATDAQDSQPTRQSGEPPLEQESAPWQTVMCSATLTSSVANLTKVLLTQKDGQDHLFLNVNEQLAVPVPDPVEKFYRDQRSAAKLQASSTDSSQGAASMSSASSVMNLPTQLQFSWLPVTPKLRLPAMCAFFLNICEKRQSCLAFLSTCEQVDFYWALFNASAPLKDQEASKMWKDGSRNSTAAQDDTEISATSVRPPMPQPGGCMFMESSGKTAGEGTASSFRVLRLHGNMKHPDRQGVLQTFRSAVKSGFGAVLLATDVAARGIDLPSLNWSVQIDPPTEVVDLVHRAGRTARAGGSGAALVFLSPQEEEYLDVLKEAGVNCSLQKADLKDILEEAGMRFPKLAHQASGRIDEAYAWCIQRYCDQCVATDSRLNTLARAAFLSFLRAYGCKSSKHASKHIFNIRKLHLGHVARTLALRVGPREVKKVAASATAGHAATKKRKLMGRDVKAAAVQAASSISASLALHQSNDELLVGALGEDKSEQTDTTPATKKRKKKGATLHVGDQAKELNSTRRAKLTNNREALTAETPTRRARPSYMNEKRLRSRLKQELVSEFL